MTQRKGQAMRPDWHRAQVERSLLREQRKTKANRERNVRALHRQRRSQAK
jgi:hypothetical protein